MKNTEKVQPPSAISDFLKNNFRDGFLFDEFREDTDENGKSIFVACINDGTSVHQLIFDSFGQLKQRDIVPAFAEEDPSGSTEAGEFHEDDY